MTSTNDGKDVKSNHISGQKGKTYFIELYKSLESKLNAECTLQERTQNLCEAWRRIHSLCQHSAPSTHLHLLSWLQRHTAETILLTEWQSPSSKELHTTLDNAISGFIEGCQSTSRDGAPPSWEAQLVSRGAGFRKMLFNPWGHDVLRVLLDPRGEAPTDQEVLEWLKEERGVVFVTRLRQLATSKCDDLALSLASFVMDRVRATLEVVPDAEQIHDIKEKPKTESKGTFADILKTEAGFTQDVWELLTDIEFVLLHKGDKRARCIDLAKQTPLRNGYQLVDRLQNRLENLPREKKLWKNAKEVATLIAQVVITRCMVVCTCAGVVRSALYWCARALARHMRLRLRTAAAALAAPAASAAHLHTLAAAVHAQSIEKTKSTEDMKPFVCELYVRAITAGMNELERLKLKTEKESEARLAEQTLCTWFNHLGILLSTSERFRCECLLTAFSVHPSPAMYERIKAAPPLPPVAVDKHEPNQEETTSEFGSWASDSRSQTNFVKTSETLNLKETKHQANVLSTAILTEGEGLGLSLDLCHDIAVLLSGPRVKTLSWDMERDMLLENCRTYMERTNFGTRALTTELKYLNLDLRDYDHLPEEDEDENDIYYGIEKGYEHLVEENREPEEIWKDAEDLERTESASSSDSESEYIVKHKRSNKKKKCLIPSDEERDPLSLEPEIKKMEKKKERPNSKERSKEWNSSKSRLKDIDPLDISEHSMVAFEDEYIDVTDIEKVPKEKMGKLLKEQKEKTPKEKKEKVPKEKKERVPKEKKEKVPREKKEKLQKDRNEIVRKETPSVSSLSNLIGLTVGASRPAVPKTITNSDYHSQNKTFLNSTPNRSTHGPNVLFDGIYNMKCPEKTLNKMTDLKSEELNLPNQPVQVKPVFGVTIQHGDFQKPVAPSSTPKRLPNNIWADVLKNERNDSQGEQPPNMKSNVKTSLSKLIRFRANRKSRNWPSQQPSKSNFYPNTIPSTENLVQSLSQNQKAQVTEGCIISPSDTKASSQKKKHNSISSPYGPVSTVSSTTTQSVTKPLPNATNVLNAQQLSQYRLDMQKHIANPLLEPPPLTSIKNNLNRIQDNTHASNMLNSKLTISPKHLNTFFNELRETINAGTNFNSKNQTLTMIPPATCDSKPHTPSPQSAKPSVIQKKSENAPNTFARLNYLHKNKTEIDVKQKKVIDAIIQHQKQSIANRAKVDELNQLIIQHKNMKFRNSPSNVIADKNTLSNNDTPKASLQKLVKNSSKPTRPNPSNIVRNNPLISDSLKVGPNISQNPISKANSQCNKQAVRSQAMASTNSSSLTEKDQQDLVSLLRQQSNQNLNHIWLKQKETMRPHNAVGNTPNLAHPVQTKIKPQNKNVHTGPVYGIDKDKLLPNASAKYSNVKNSEAKLSQQRPVYHMKTDTKLNNKNTQNEIQAQSNKSYLDKSKQTDWESVMDTILSLKTPSRDINRQNTKSIDKPLLNSNLKNQDQTKSNNVKTSLKNVAEPPSIKSDKTCNVNNSNINRPETSSYKRTTNLEHSNKQLQDVIRTTSVIKKTVQYCESPETLNILKEHDTCPLSSQQDPFISGLPNTDYDLLEEFELMDDELRQEIGELSSDEENFDAKQLLAGANNKVINPVQEVKQMAYPTPSSTNAPPLTTIQAPTLKKPAPKVKVESITIARPADPLPLKQPVLVGEKSVNIGYKSVQEVTPTIQAPNIVHQLPKNIIISTKNGNQTLLVNSEPRIIQPATVVTPQPTALQNVVLIGSEIVYQPCAVRSQIQGALNVQQNSFVSVNASPTVALYQTTRFAAPVLNPVIIGNAITTTSMTPSIVQNIPVQNISESMPTLLTEAQIEEAVSAVIPEVSHTKIDLNNDTLTEVSDICGELLNQAVNDKTIQQTKENIDVNSSKNCERKVLSEVQEKLACAENLEINHKIQRIYSELDQEHKMRINKERLDKKRMAILNRKVCHRIKKKPIPLAYAPLFPMKPGAETDLAVLKLKSLVDSKIISVKELNKNNEANGKTDKDENCKENESDRPARRILLRSSNKLDYSNVSAQETNVDDVIPNGAKTAKVRLKRRVDVTPLTEKSLKDCSKSPKANKRKIKKTTVKSTQTRQSNRLLKRLDEPKMISNKETISCNNKLEPLDISEILDLEKQVVGSEIPKEDIVAIRSDESSGNSIITGESCDVACQTLNFEAKRKNSTEHYTRVKPDQVISNHVYLPSSEKIKPKEKPVGLVNVQNMKPDLVKEVETAKQSIETKTASAMRQEGNKLNNSDTNKTSVSEQINIQNKLTGIGSLQKDHLPNDPRKNIPLKLSDEYLDDKSKPEQTLTQSISTKMNSLKGDVCPSLNSNNNIPQNQKVSAANDSEVICLDDGDDPLSVKDMQFLHSHIVNDSTSSSKNEEVQNLDSLSPEQVKERIKIENLTYPGPVDPLKKVVRITMPSGKAFKATIHGQVNVDIDALFSDPTLRSIITENMSKKQRYSLNINHTGTLPLNNSMVSQFGDENGSKPVETIDLLSDSDDETPQVFTTEFGNFKVKAMEQTIYEKHQKRFMNKCVVTFKKSNFVSQIKEKQEDSSYANSRELVGSKRTRQLDSINDTLVNSEIIDVDDSSSNDELILPDVDIPGSRLQTITEPIQKINEFKKLLLNELGFQDNVDDLNTKFDQNLEIGSTTTNIRSKAIAKEISENVITSATEDTKHLEELIEVKSPQENTKTIDSLICGELISKAPNFSSKLPVSTPVVQLDCFIKLTKCDNLVKKYEELKLMKKCSITLARCDENTKDNVKEINKTLEFLEESDDHIMDVVPLSRSGSFSILNDYAIFENQDKVSNLEQIKLDVLRANSPVMEAYDIIISSSQLQFNRQIKERQEDLHICEKSYCHSDWHYAKQDLSLQCKVNVTQWRDQNNRKCTSEWFSTKYDLHLMEYETNSPPYCKPERSLTQNDDDDMNDSECATNCTNVCDSILTKMCIVPSLKLILINYFNNSNTLDHLILARKLNLTKNLKRKSSDSFDIKRKLPRKAKVIDNGILQIESNDSNTVPLAIKIKCGDATQNSKIIEDNNNSQIVTDDVSLSSCVLTEMPSNSLTTGADDEVIELHSDSSKTGDISETDSISILCETLDSNIDLITEAHENIYYDSSNDMAFLSKNENCDIECTPTDEKQVEMIPIVNIEMTDFEIDKGTEEVSYSNLLMGNKTTHCSDDDLRDEKQIEVIDSEMSNEMLMLSKNEDVIVDVECDQTVNMTNDLIIKNNVTHCFDVDLSDEKRVEVDGSEITNEIPLSNNKDLSMDAEFDPNVNIETTIAQISNNLHCLDFDLTNEEQVNSKIPNKTTLSKVEDLPMDAENMEMTIAQINNEKHCAEVELANEKQVQVDDCKIPNKMKLSKNENLSVDVTIESDVFLNMKKTNTLIGHNTAEVSDSNLLMRHNETHCLDVDSTDENRAEIIDPDLSNKMTQNKYGDLSMDAKFNPNVNIEITNTEIVNSTEEVSDSYLLVKNNKTYCSDVDLPHEKQVEVISPEIRNEMTLSKNEDLSVNVDCDTAVNVEKTNIYKNNNTKEVSDSNLFEETDETRSDEDLRDKKQVEVMDPEIRKEMTLRNNEDINVDCDQVVDVEKRNTQIDNNTAEDSDSNLLKRNNEIHRSTVNLLDKKQVYLIGPELTNEMTRSTNEVASLDVACDPTINMTNTEIYHNIEAVSDSNLLIENNETHLYADLPHEKQVEVTDSEITDDVPLINKSEDVFVERHADNASKEFSECNLLMKNTETHCSNIDIPNEQQIEEVDSKKLNDEDVFVDVAPAVDIQKPQIDKEVSDNMLTVNNESHSSNSDLHEQEVVVVESEITIDKTFQSNNDSKKFDVICSLTKNLEVTNTHLDNKIEPEILNSDVIDQSDDLICNLVKSPKAVKVFDHEYTTELTEMERTNESNAHLNEERTESPSTTYTAQNSYSEHNMSFSSDNASITEEIVDMHSEEIIDVFINGVIYNERLEKVHIETDFNPKFEPMKVKQNIDQENKESGIINPTECNTNSVVDKMDLPLDIIFVNSEMEAELPRQISKEENTNSLETDTNTSSGGILIVDPENIKLKNTSKENTSEANIITNNQLESQSLSGGGNADGPPVMHNISNVISQTDDVNTINHLQHNYKEIITPETSLYNSTVSDPVKFKDDSHIIRENVLNDNKIRHQISDDTKICDTNEHTKIKVSKKTSEFFKNACNVEVNTLKILSDVNAANVENDNNDGILKLPTHKQPAMEISANEVIVLQTVDPKTKQTIEVKAIATSNMPNIEHVNMNPVVLLEGIEVEDSEIGKYVYVLPEKKPIAKSRKDFDILNHASKVVFDDEDKCIEVRKPNKTYSRNMTIDFTSTRKSGRILKRKSDMTDVKTIVKKYRKGKNIDYPKFTITSIRETAYMQEFQRLFDYCSTVKFSYSRPFHIECIDVVKMIKAWPINSSLQIKEIPHEKDENLFKDNDNNVTVQDPLDQTLADEIVTDYTESNYSACKVVETNFNMGFGEGSGKVIQNLEEECGLKFSAATLSDVKQYQPPLMCDNEKHNATYQNQFDVLNRQLQCIQQKNRIREFFKNSMMDLHDDNVKKHCQKDILQEKVISDFPYKYLLSTEFIQPASIQVLVNVVQVGQLPVSAAAQNPVTCDPRVTQVSNVSPSQCSAENSPNDDPNSVIKTEYTELTTADFSIPLAQNYAQHMQSIREESHEMTNLAMGEIPMEDMRPVIKVELEEIPEIKQEAPDDINEGNDSPTTIIEKLEPCDTNSSQTSPETNTDMMYDSSEKSPTSEAPQQYLNGSSEKIDQIAHAMNAAGIATSETTNSRPHPLLNILNHKLRQGTVTASQSGTNTYSKPTSINAMALQQALAHILPPPLNHTNVTENHQQASNAPVTQQVLHIVQSKNASGNQITLVDNSQPSVINTPNSTPVLHIVQNKGVTNSGPPSNGTPPTPTNSFGGLSLVDAGIQQGNQLLHIVNTGNQKNANPSQILKRVNLLTNLTNVQGSNEQKMVQFVCKSADGKAIQLNAPHQRSMVLRLQPYDTPNLQAASKTMEAPDLSPTSNSTNNINKDMASQQEIKSRSIYEENYAKFIQNSSSKTNNGSEKATSLPKFNQAFGKQIYQDGSQNKETINKNSHLLSENTECQPNEGNINLEHISQINSPPLLLRKSPAQTSQPQQNLVQQLKQTIAPMNMTMHGGVIYTRQIPVNLGSGQTINLITVPSTELVDDSAPKPQGDVKFVNQNEIEQSIIKIVPQTQSAPSSENVIAEDNNANIVLSNEGSQPQQVLTQMRIKLPMLSKAPQMVSGARVVRPSFFQIQRNVIGGANQPVYQQLVLTAAPPLGQRLPQTQTTRQIKVPSESQSSTESMSSSTLEQLREFDLVLEQVKERSTVQPNATSAGAFSKIHASSTDATDSPTPSGSKPTESTQQVLYSIGNNQPVNVAFVNRKSTSATPTPSTSSFVRSPDSSSINDSPTPSSHAKIPHTVTSETAASSETPAQPKSSKSSSKSKSRPKTSNPPNTLKLNTVPPKTSNQKPLEDEQTTQRILYILAEYKEQVENSPDKDKPAPRRRTNLQCTSGSHKRKKCSGGSRRSGRDMSPIHGEDTSRTMGSEDSSCGTSQGDCNESCIDSHSPQDSPRKVVRKLTFENETNPINQPHPQPQRNVIVADGQTITVARGTAGKPATAVLMPANYILPVSMVKSGQQIAIVTNRGPKLLTVSGGEGGATNALLLQRLISPAGLKPMLARPGVRHVRLPTSALHNLQAFNLTSMVHPPDSNASPAPAPPELIETRANSSPWADRESQDVKPERGSSPEGSEPWNLPTSADPHDYVYEETVRADNMNRTVLEPIPDRYSPDMEAQRIFDKMFEVDSKKSYMVDPHDDSVRCGFDIDTSDCDDKPYHQVVHRKEGATHRQHHRLSHVSSAALRHKYAILEHELRLQKSLSEECEDLGVDSPSAAELFPEAELLFGSSPAHDHIQDQAHHSHTPQPIITHTIPQPDLDDQIATDQLLPRQDDRDISLGLEDVGIVTVSEDGMQATIQLDQEEFARSHPNTTFHSEPTDEGEMQPFTISSIKGRHITSTIFHANRAPGTVLMGPHTTVISQATPETSSQAIKYADLDNVINSLPPGNNINLPSVVVKDDGGLRFDHILNDARKLQLSHTASTIVHSAGNATQVIRRVCYDDRARERDNRYLIDDSDAIIAGDDAKMVADDSRDGSMMDDRSSPERTELFWDSNSISERSESRRPMDYSSDSDKCCKSPTFDEANSTDSSGVGPHMRLDSVIKDARGIERSASADGSSADDVLPPLRTYPPKRSYTTTDGERSVSGKTRAGERSPDSPEVRRRASVRGVVKRGCHCCNGSPAPPRPKKPRQRKPTVDFASAD